MSPWQSFREALRLLAAQPLRSALTLFGLVWGTAAVIFLVSWGIGLRTMLDTGFERAGKNLMVTWGGRISADFSPAVDRRFLWYTREDVTALRRRAQESELVAGETRGFLPVAFRGRTYSLDVRGVEPEGVEIRGVEAANGRLISREDVDQRRRVAVMGHRARERLLGAEGGVGSRLRIDGTSFQVVGVLARVGTQLSRDGPEIDDQVWVPLTTHLVRWPNPWLPVDMLSQIIARTRDRARVDEAERELRAVLAERLGVAADDEEAVPTFSVVKMMRRIPIDQQNGLNLLIALTTLLVGGIGILALMLDSVAERRAEIGVRLALGARRREVLLQFLWEGVAVVVVGGGLGVALGLGGAGFLASDAFRSRIPPALRDLVPIPEVSLAVVGLALAAMATVALVAAGLPAWRAARVDPAESLRVE